MPHPSSPPFPLLQIKLDGCGKQLDLQLYADLFNATGKSILMENCHWG